MTQYSSLAKWLRTIEQDFRIPQPHLHKPSLTKFSKWGDYIFLKPQNASWMPKFVICVHNMIFKQQQQEANNKGRELKVKDSAGRLANRMKLKQKLLVSSEQAQYHRSGRPCQLDCKTWVTSLRVLTKLSDGTFRLLTKCWKRLINTRIWLMVLWGTFSISIIYFERARHTQTSKK